MGEFLNRLTKAEAIKWDKAFENFYKTGVWDMNNEEKITEDNSQEPIKLSTEPKTCPTHIGLEKHNIMADPSQRGRFPGSRDWDLEALNISCFRKTCVANNNKTHKCVMPSLIAIDKNGKCSDYKSKKKTKKDKER